MNSFLYRVARALFSEYGEGISKFTFVFPNRRAGLFFRKYLTTLINKPVFSPEVITVNDCFFSASELQPADRISMLFRLYSIYKELSHSTESFDAFAFWGEMLLSDFNEVDRYLVNAQQLFTNVTELKDIEDTFEHLTDNQLNAIRQFWKDFANNIELKKSRKDFVEIWKVLFAIYQQFTNELLNEETGTDGMIMRGVAERCKRNEEFIEWEEKYFVFVGFNALNPCEKELMKYLQRKEKADFYWDYEWDILRSPENPASSYFTENVHSFPSKIELTPEAIEFSDKHIELVSVPSSTGQAKEVYRILRDLNTENISKDWLKTAVVLPDENLLLPVINSIPAEVDKVNVTMGYPLNFTPMSGLVESIYELQKRKQHKNGENSFYYRTVLNVLNHQYIKALYDNDVNNIVKKIQSSNLIYVKVEEFEKNMLFKVIFQPIENPVLFPDYLLSVFDKLYYNWLSKIESEDQKLPVTEYLYYYFTTVTRLKDVLEKNKIDSDLQLDTVMRMIRQLISGVTIPYSGEPLEGLQVMGVLETRGLDFDNLIITSFNEGILPKKNNSQSFVPYSLRKCFGLPVYEQQDAIMSYNFYRLLQRAKRVYMIYDSRSEGMNTGEVSRFYYQLKYHYNLDVELVNTTFDLFFGQSGQIKIEKTAEVMEKLQRFIIQNEENSALSASSINNYVDCPLKFYLSSVEKIREQDELTEIPGSDVFGSVFHAAMEYIYEPYIERTLTKYEILQLTEDERSIKEKIYKAISVKYLNIKDGRIIIPEGNLLLISEAIFKYVIRALETDANYAPFRYIASEKEFFVQLPVDAGVVNIKGFIDRIDEKEGKIRILDYKTGSDNLKFKSLDEVFSHDKAKRNGYVLQTMLYGLYYSSLEMNNAIIPGLYFIRKTFSDDFDTSLIHNPATKENYKVENFKEWEEDFKEHLINSINEIFNPEIPFFQTTEVSNCRNCSFTGICKR